MKRLSMFAVLLFSCFIMFPVASYGAGCSNSTLIGTYGYREAGLTSILPEFAYRFTRFGLLNFDGKGTGTLSFSGSFGDSGLDSGSTTISYSVAPDCTFTFMWDSTSQVFSGVIVSDGQQVDYTETSGWWLITGQAAKVNGRCSVATLTGAYGYHHTGLKDWIHNYTTFGQFTFDGKGKGTGSYTITNAQFQNVDSGSGIPISYSVTPNCTFMLTWEDSGQQFSGVVVKRGQQLDFMESSGWWLASGQAIKTTTQNEQ